MVDRRIPQKLELLVQGELGRAVLDGFFVVGYEMFSALLDQPGGAMLVKEAYERAFTEAGRLAVPASVPAEIRAEWRQAAIEAAYYTREYMPAFVADESDGGGN